LKNAYRSLFLLCLTSFGLLAASSNLFAQTTLYSAPKYQVMAVVYAPPGSASNVTYTNSEMVGSTIALSRTNGISNTTNVSVSTGGGWGNSGLFGVSATVTEPTTTHGAPQ
jgi:hypothetical protein